jgi:hypothetical protein
MQLNKFFILLIAIGLSFPCSSQVAHVGDLVDSMIVTQFLLWDNDNTGKSKLLKYKKQGYNGTAVRHHLSKIYEDLGSGRGVVEVYWFYNPLEFKEYVYIVKLDEEQKAQAYEYYLTRPHYNLIGEAEDTILPSVVRLLCDRKEQILDDALFFHVTFSPNSVIDVVVPAEFSMETELQVMYLVLQSSFNNDKR